MHTHTWLCREPGVCALRARREGAGPEEATEEEAHIGDSRACVQHSRAARRTWHVPETALLEGVEEGSGDDGERGSVLWVMMSVGQVCPRGCTGWDSAGCCLAWPSSGRTGTPRYHGKQPLVRRPSPDPQG